MMSNRRGTAQSRMSVSGDRSSAWNVRAGVAEQYDPRSSVLMGSRDEHQERVYDGRDMDDMRRQFIDLAETVAVEKRARDSLQRRMTEFERASETDRGGVRVVSDLSIKVDSMVSTVHKVQEDFKEQSEVLRDLMNMMEDTMPIGETHELLEKHEARIQAEVEQHMDAVSEEFEMMNAKLDQRSDNALEQISAIDMDLKDVMRQNPGTGMEELELKLAQLERMFDDLGPQHAKMDDMAMSLEELIGIQTENEREVQARAMSITKRFLELEKHIDQSKASAETEAAGAAANRQEIQRLAEAVAQLEEDFVAKSQLASSVNVDGRVATLDDEMQDLIDQTKSGFEKLHHRMDCFTKEVQQFVSQQTNANDEAASTAIQLRTDWNETKLTCDSLKSSLKLAREDIEAQREREYAVQAQYDQVSQQEQDNERKIDVLVGSLSELGENIADFSGEATRGLQETTQLKLMCQQLEERHQTHSVDLETCKTELSELADELSQHAAQHRQRADALASDIAAKYDKTAEAGDALQAQVVEISGQVNERIDTVTSSVAQCRSDLTDKMNVSNEALQTQLQQAQTAQEQTVRVFVSHWSSDLETYRTRLDERLKKSADAQNQAVATIRSAMNTKLDSSVTALESRVMEKLQTQNRQLRQQESDQNERIDGVRGGVEQLITDLRMSTDSRLIKLDSDTNGHMERVKSFFTQQLAERASAQDSRLDKFDAENRDGIQRFRTAVEQQLTDQTGSMGAQMQDLETRLTSDITNQRMDIQRLETHVSEKTAEAIRHVETRLADALQDQDTRTTSQLESGVAVLRALITDTHDHTETTMLNKFHDQSQRIEEYENSLREHIDAVKDTTEKQFSEVRETATDNLATLSSDVNAQIVRARSEFSRDLSDHSDELDERMGELETSNCTVTQELRDTMKDQIAELEDAIDSQLSDFETSINEASQQSIDRDQAQTDATSKRFVEASKETDEHVRDLIQAQDVAMQQLESNSNTRIEAVQEDLGTRLESVSRTAAVDRQQLTEVVAHRDAEVMELKAHDAEVEHTLQTLQDAVSMHVASQESSISETKARVDNLENEASSIREQCSSAVEQSQSQVHAVNDALREMLDASIEGVVSDLQNITQQYDSAFQEIDNQQASHEERVATDLNTITGEIAVHHNTQSAQIAQLKEDVLDHSAHLDTIDSLTQDHTTSVKNAIDQVDKLAESNISGANALEEGLKRVSGEIAHRMHALEEQVQPISDELVVCLDRLQTLESAANQLSESCDGRLSELEDGEQEQRLSINQMEELSANQTQTVQELVESTARIEAASDFAEAQISQMQAAYNGLADLRDQVVTHASKIADQDSHTQLLTTQMSAQTKSSADATAEYVARFVNLEEASIELSAKTSEIQALSNASVSALKDLQSSSKTTVSRVDQLFKTVDELEQGMHSKIDGVHLDMTERSSQQAKNVFSNHTNIEELMASVDALSKQASEHKETVDQHDQFLQDMQSSNTEIQEVVNTHDARILQVEEAFNGTNMRLTATSQSLQDFQKAQQAAQHGIEATVLRHTNRLTEVTTELSVLRELTGDLAKRVSTDAAHTSARVAEIDACSNATASTVASHEQRINTLDDEAANIAQHVELMRAQAAQQCADYQRTLNDLATRRDQGEAPSRSQAEQQQRMLLEAAVNTLTLKLSAVEDSMSGIESDARALANALSQQNHEVDSVRTDLQEAQDGVLDAARAVQSLGSKVQMVVSMSVPPQKFEELRTTVEELDAKLKGETQQRKALQEDSETRARVDSESTRKTMQYIMEHDQKLMSMQGGSHTGRGDSFDTGALAMRVSRVEEDLNVHVAAKLQRHDAQLSQLFGQTPRYAPDMLSETDSIRNTRTGRFVPPTLSRST